MRILRHIKKLLHIANNAITVSNKLELYSDIIESTVMAILVLDKNRYIKNIYNLNATTKTGLSGNHIEKGNHLRHYANDKSSPFCFICDTLDKAIDKALSTRKPETSECRIENYYLRSIVSIIKDGDILIQIQDITDIAHKIDAFESESYKELSMAITAGGLTSWSYDADTGILSSPQPNNITGQITTLNEMLTRTLSEYQEVVVDMFESILNHKTTNGEMSIQILDTNNVVQWVNVHAIPLKYNSKGDILVIVGSQKNISQEHEYNENIRLLNNQNKLILNNIKSALVYITTDYRVVWENVSTVFRDTCMRNYYKKDTYCYTSFNRDTPCEDCVMQRSLSSLKSESKEYSIESLFIEITATPKIGEHNVVDGIVLKMDNFTDKKKNMQNLRSAEYKASATNRLLSAILDNFPSSIFVKDVDDDYRYIISNKQLCTILGLPEKEIVGKTDYEIFPTKEEADKYRKDDINSMETNEIKIINEEMVSVKNGIMVSYTIKTPLVNVTEDNKRLLVGIGMDITERHNAYQELAEAKKRADESDKLKSAFLANMSHEIRTPLNAIVGFSELMEACEDRDEKTEYMRIISENNKLLLRLINDILDLSKLESGIVQFHNSEFDIVTLINELLFTMKQQVIKPNIEFTYDNPYKSCIVKADKVRMTQIWQNYISNATKYTMSGYIKVGYEYINSGIKLYVEDTGIGISDNKKSKLFHRFEKLDSFAQGTGLGLSICKTIAELNGGNVGCDSEEGKGSKFWAWMPMEAKIDTGA